jgi:hypothetical protein
LKEIDFAYKRRNQNNQDEEKGEYIEVHEDILKDIEKS